MASALPPSWSSAQDACAAAPIKRDTSDLRSFRYVPSIEFVKRVTQAMDRQVQKVRQDWQLLLVVRIGEILAVAVAVWALLQAAYVPIVSWELLAWLDWAPMWHVALAVVCGGIALGLHLGAGGLRERLGLHAGQLTALLGPEGDDGQLRHTSAMISQRIETLLAAFAYRAAEQRQTGEAFDVIIAGPTALTPEFCNQFLLTLPIAPESEEAFVTDLRRAAREDRICGAWGELRVSPRDELILTVRPLRRVREQNAPWTT